MNELNCEYVSDLLPELLNGRLDDGRAAAVRTHLGTCEACASELTLVRTIRQYRTTPSEALDRRIVAVALNRPRVFRFRPQLALAATLAVAVLGAGILLARQTTTPPPGSVQPVAGAEQRGPGWVGVDAALVSGAASLQDLTVEELEQLLVEVGS